MIQKYKDSNIL